MIQYPNAGGIPWSTQQGIAYPKKSPVDPATEQLRKYIQEISKNSQWLPVPPAPQVVVQDKKLEDFSEMEIIMELIGRGYAVSKLPVDEHVEAAK